jgi:hypothetical protein
MQEEEVSLILPRVSGRWTPSWISRRHPKGFEVAPHEGSKHRRHLGHDKPRRGSKFV